jgi:hypothetical protein
VLQKLTAGTQKTILLLLTTFLLLLLLAPFTKVLAALQNSNLATREVLCGKLVFLTDQKTGSQLLGLKSCDGRETLLFSQHPRELLKYYRFTNAVVGSGAKVKTQNGDITNYIFGWNSYIPLNNCNECNGAASPPGANQQTPQSSDPNCKQIRFAVKSGSFRWISINGTNQRGEVVTWSPTPLSGNDMFLAETTNWWWKDMIIIRFTGKGSDNAGRSWSGDRQCVIDVLKRSTSSKYTTVIYSESTQSCTGDEGSAAPVDKIKRAVDAFYKVYIDDSDSAKILNYFEDIDGAAGCLEELTTGMVTASRLSGVMKMIKISMACKNQLGFQRIQELSEILIKYHFTLEQ